MMCKNKNLRRGIILLIILFSVSVASADNKYYWDRTTGVSIAGLTTNWSSCSGSPQTGYRITSIGSTASACLNGAISRTSVGDMFLEIFPTAYASNMQIKGINATFYLGRPSNSGTTTYRFNLGYVQAGVFTSFGYVTQSLTKSSNRLVTINMNTTSGTAPAGSNLAMKINVTAVSGTAQVNLGTNGGSTGSNSGRFYINETVPPPTPTYNVTVTASPISAVITQGGNYIYNITVNNTGNTIGNYTLSVTDSDTVNFTSSVLGVTAMQINSGGSAMTTLTVSANNAATAIDTTTVTVNSVENPVYTNSTHTTTTVAGGEGGDICTGCHAGAE